MNKEKNVLEYCEEFAKKRGYEFMSINKYKDGYRINFKEYDGDGYIIHKIKYSPNFNK